MSLKGGIQSEFPGYSKICKLSDGRLYLDGIYMPRSDVIDFMEWLEENFE